ncbi:hypothetical protein FOA52_006850 [Chlamydomonas sp. UWO 241]|nr:hypothetical protein FOA52_006850 [Chlamydomonas sp. UWO 241]
MEREALVPTTRWISMLPPISEEVAPSTKPSSTEGATVSDAVLEYEDGSTYEGPLRRGLRHGKGLFTSPNGFSYKGRFVDGKAEDFGEAVYCGGALYVGEWAADLRSGFGEFSMPSGDTYAGMWEGDVMHGHGRWTFADGSYFEGSYMGGRRTSGTMASADGREVYTGDFDGNVRHGQGTQLVEGAWHYRGAWDNDMRHGHGECRYLPSAASGPDSGGRYVGAWARDVRSGFGRMEWPSGEVYEGEWADDRTYGRGRGVSANGDVYVGEWAGGRRKGHGKCAYACGDRYDGEWKDGQRHGTGTMAYADKEVYSGAWRAGLRHGMGTALFSDGTRFTGAWENGDWVQGLAEPRLCRVSGPGMSRAVAGQVARFVIEARDAAGNRRLNGGDSFQVTVRSQRLPQAAAPLPVTDLSTPGAGAAPGNPALLALALAQMTVGGGSGGAGDGAVGAPVVVVAEAEVEDLDNGTYRVSYQVVAAGIYELAVDTPAPGSGGDDGSSGADFTAVADSPYVLRVIAGPPAARNTRTVLSCGGSVRAGEGASLRVQLRDALDNACSGTRALAALPVTVRLVGGSGGMPVTDVQVAGVAREGAYMCAFTAPKEPGLYRLEVVVQRAQQPVVPSQSEVPPQPEVQPEVQQAQEEVLPLPPPRASSRLRPMGAGLLEEVHLPGSPFALLVHPPAGDGGKLHGTGVPAVVATNWEERAREMYAAEDGSWEGWEDGPSSAAGPPGGLSAHEAAVVGENPGLPVVERLEDLWRLGKLQAAQKRWGGEAAT